MTIQVGGTTNPALIKIPFRGLHVEGEMISQLDFLNFITQLASVTCSYFESTFTLTANGASGATGSAIGTTIGNVAIIVVPQISGTSSATTLTLTGLPANFIPTNTSPTLPIMVTNGSTDGMGCLHVGSNGTITVSSAVTRSGGFPVAWSGTGLNGVIGGTIVYRLTN